MIIHNCFDRNNADLIKDFLRTMGATARLMLTVDGWVVLEIKEDK